MIWKFNSICKLDYKYTTHSMFNIFIATNVNTCMWLSCSKVNIYTESLKYMNMARLFIRHKIWSHSVQVDCCHHEVEGQTRCNCSESMSPVPKSDFLPHPGLVLQRSNKNMILALKILINIIAKYHLLGDPKSRKWLFCFQSLILFKG